MAQAEADLQELLHLAHRDKISLETVLGFTSRFVKDWCAKIVIVLNDLVFRV